MTPPAVLYPRTGIGAATRRAIEAAAAAGRSGWFVDLDRFAERCRSAVRAAEPYGVRLLLAVKSTTVPELLRVAAGAGLGFDVANMAEYDAVVSALDAGTPPFVSMTSPALPPPERDRLLDAIGSGRVHRCHWDSLGQFGEACRSLPVQDAGVRVNLDGEDLPEAFPQVTPSRFGVRARDLAAVRETAERAGRRLRWLHTHNGSEENDHASFVTAAEVVLRRAREAGLRPAALDLGGGLRGDPAALPGLFEKLRAVAGDVEIVLEPGQFWTQDCGYLATQVLDVKPLDDRILVVCDCGTLNHLQWSTAPALPRLGRGAGSDRRPYVLCGRTCFESDYVGAVPPRAGAPAPRPGDWLVVGGVNGYSAELGSAFNGIAPHPPVLISERYWDTASETPPESVEKMSS
ncbi:diaminopimelate decarboxylase family protein [Actinomadura welshii]|uniref:diaminopimelate decarboxylase family protein n=1 Tax=Actinomadura welshii TaxID=3103817 RepID=UPI0003AD5463|nr:hypothetical protein [Actinomadura madurae]